MFRNRVSQYLDELDESQRLARGNAVSPRSVKTATKVGTRKPETIFANNFSSALDAWESEESGRSARLFADLIGLDPRNLANWKSKGLKPHVPKPDEPLYIASGFLGVNPRTWWDAEPTTVERVAMPTAYELEISQTLIRHAGRKAFTQPEFRKALQQLVEKQV